MSLDRTKQQEPSSPARRKLLGTGAMMFGGLATQKLFAADQLQSPAATPKVRTRPDDGTFTVAIVGETMATRPFRTDTNANFLEVCKLLRESDLSYAHLEMNLAADNQLGWAMRGSSGGAGYLVANPVLAQDLKWAGVDVMSVAQNHSLDWGPEGMLATIDNCNAAGIATAGTGRNLEAAREPTYFENSFGRMSLISIASGNSAFEWAGLPKGKTPGRPGVNPLRVKTVYEVPKDTADQLKAAGKGLGVMKPAAMTEKDFNITPGAISGSNGFSGFTFREGEKFRITTESNPADLRGNLRAVSEANKWSDYVMVAQHNSTSEGGRGVTPSDFIVEFARKAIDAGADAYFGHGWHTFLGIEIYKGKPIFYGLGSFFWQSQYIPRVPADEYESYNVDMDNLLAVNPASGGLHPEGTPDWGWAGVYQLKYKDKKLTQILLHPIEMGYDYSGDKPRVYRTVGNGETKYLDGSPQIATGANKQKILEYLQKTCALRGTTMVIKDGVGVINLA